MDENQVVINRFKAEKVSYVVIGAFLLSLFYLNLMPALLGGLVVFLIINKINKIIEKNVRSQSPNKLTLLIISGLVLLILLLIGIGVYSSLQVGTGSVEEVSIEAMNVLNQLKNYVPHSWLEHVPEDVFELKNKAIEFSKIHVSEMVSFTSHSLKSIVEVILGMFIGAVVAFNFLNHHNEKTEDSKIKGYVFLEELLKRIKVFTNVFAKVGGAQIKISAINTVLTAIYLLIIIPLTGNSIPYAKTLVLLTFIVGIIPVIGNLISNTLIVSLSLMVSLKIAIISLIFLVVVHKLEYYINAQIVGQQIKTSIWELLIVMIFFQTVFGIIGVVLAPVIYGYVKEELKLKKIIP